MPNERTINTEQNEIKIPHEVTKIDENSFTNASVLSEKTTCILYRGRLYNKDVVRKMLRHQLIEYGEDFINLFRKEILLMHKIGKHTNIVTFYGYTLKPLSIFMRFVPGMNLKDLLANRTRENLK